MIGKLLACFCTVGYTGSTISFFMAGRHYEAITTKSKFRLNPFGKQEKLDGET